tara:strand:+ start:277 stop:729 length:453 start_codon:yes stop_codon:yes gene_type:complete
MVGLHRAPAGGHEGEVIPSTLHGFKGCAVFVDVLEEVHQEGFSIVAKEAWSGHHVPTGFLLFEFESDRCQSVPACSNTFHGSCVEVQRDGDQPPLPFPQGFVMAQPFVSNAFVEGVLVDQKQFIPCLNQHVGASKLAEWDHVGQVVQHSV